MNHGGGPSNDRRPTIDDYMKLQYEESNKKTSLGAVKTTEESKDFDEKNSLLDETSSMQTDDMIDTEDEDDLGLSPG